MSNLTPNNGHNLSNGFRLDKGDAKVFGVCAGLANWSGVDALWWRLGFVTCTVLGIGFPILLYIAIALLAD